MTANILPISDLHFRIGNRHEAEQMVLDFHYSKRVPSNVVMIGSLHLDGGLFGGDGKMVAAAFFSIPPTRWKEPTIELSRLVRAEEKVPLSHLISKCVKELRKKNIDLLVSFADKTQGHEGYVYRASNWNYHGCREKRNDGLIINGSFVPGRTCNSIYGTRSKRKLESILTGSSVEEHYDEGKHLYWLAIKKTGEAKAKRLGLGKNGY